MSQQLDATHKDLLESGSKLISKGNFIPLNSMKGPDKRIHFSLSTYWQKLGLVTHKILFGCGFFRTDKRVWQKVLYCMRLEWLERTDKDKISMQINGQFAITKKVKTVENISLVASLYSFGLFFKTSQISKIKD